MVRAVAVVLLFVMPLVTSSLVGTPTADALTFTKTLPEPFLVSGGELSTYSCVRGPVCVALGWNHHGNAGYLWAVRWHDGTWSRFRPPSLGIDGQFNPTISCATKVWCMATGSSGLNVSDHPVADEWVGGRWKSLNVPTPLGSTDFELYKLYCRSTTWCIAVGSYVANKPNYEDSQFLAAELWNGIKWRMVPIYSPRTYAQQIDPGMVAGGAHPTASPQQLSCVSKTFCIIAGFFAGVFVEQWNGQRWSEVHAPNATQPVARASEFAGVACVSRTFCIAAGGYAVSNAAWRPLLEKWNGNVWRILQLPELSKLYDHGTGLSLSQVECASSKFCIAFGSPEFGERGSNSLMWNGRSWSYISTGNPAKPTFDCLTMSNCLLVE